MTELQELNRRVAIVQAQIKVMGLYGAQFEKSLSKLVEDLARDGYSREEISEALLATLPTLQDGLAMIPAKVEAIMTEATNG